MLVATTLLTLQNKGWPKMSGFQVFSTTFFPRPERLNLQCFTGDGSFGLSGLFRFFWFRPVRICSDLNGFRRPRHRP